MTSDTHEQAPPTPSDAIAHWFDDVFRIYGEMVDSQRRLAVAMVRASSPLLDVGEKAAAGAERLSATAQQRGQVVGGGSTPASGEDARDRDDDQRHDGSEDVRGDESTASATVDAEAVDEHEDSTTPDVAVTADLDTAAPTAPEVSDREAEEADHAGDTGDEESPGVDAAADGTEDDSTDPDSTDPDSERQGSTRDDPAATGRRDDRDDRRPDVGGDRAEQRRASATRRSSGASRTSGASKTTRRTTSGGRATNGRSASSETDVSSSGRRGSPR
ncbi:MAG TPA: hypothetical protein VGH76_15340 [Actinomycetospora sp.]|jgi:hypothetical protein|uniref:hypothetical protein n=1 Tax=Actinomycetospora sp. TaxID=1872135 RepID=UPI002F3E43E2